ncbi:MAG: pilus assembly protein N-terminal domain-containing protein [Candidatus Omnitrophica bacterium]|nr:pilus assembly protein N-terminal domain-containing protein [Candidatus Omnitrophota bacterium]
MKKTFIILTLIFFALSNFPALGIENLSDIGEGQELRMVLGNIATFRTEELKKIMISNPQIADAINVTTNEITLEPKASGTTEINYVDKKGEHKIYLRVLGRDLEALKRGIDEIIQNANIKGVIAKINYEAQKVYLIGEVLNEADKERLTAALGPLAADTVDIITTQEQKIPVEISVEAVELNKNDVDQLGIQWVSKDVPFTTITEHPFELPSDSNKLSSLSRRLGEGFRVGYTSRTGIKADINLLVQKGRAKILSRPKLICLSGKEAEFFVGGEVPVLTVTVSGGGGVSGTVTPNVEYKKYGITLKIKPHIRENNEIELNVNTEVKDIDETRGVTITGSVDAPAFITRNASTELYLKENETVFLAGLISDKKKDTTQKVPFLGNLPVVGELFKNKEESVDQIELLISLTPRIVRLPSEEVQVQAQQKSNPVLEYGRLVQKALSEAIKLLPEDRDAKLVITLVVACDGTVKQAQLKQPSGIKDIDEAIIYIVNKKSLFPAFPSQLKEKEISLDIPIVFKRTSQS